jgi:hypothetical protein
MMNQSNLSNAQEGSSERRGRPAGLVPASWDDTAETMWNEVARAVEAGMTKSAAYAEQAKKLGRTVSGVGNKYRKMARAKQGGETGGMRMPNEMKNQGRKGELTMVRYYAKDDNDLETFLGTGPENAAFAVIKAFQHGSSVAQ